MRSALHLRRMESQITLEKPISGLQWMSFISNTLIRRSLIVTIVGLTTLLTISVATSQRCGHQGVTVDERIRP